MTSLELNWHLANKYDALHVYHYSTPVGDLSLLTQGSVLCHIEWLITSASRQIPQPLPDELKKQIEHFWLTPNREINLPLLDQGTPFQKKVWQALCHIPIGQTKSYGELAQELQTGARAIANACRKNPFPLIIPCHRVVAKKGIGGYAGAITGRLITLKIDLLQHEKMLTNER